MEEKFLEWTGVLNRKLSLIFHSVKKVNIYLLSLDRNITKYSISNSEPFFMSKFIKGNKNRVVY